MIADANIFTFLYFLFSIFFLFVHLPSCSANYELGVEAFLFFCLCISILFDHVSLAGAEREGASLFTPN